MEILHIKSEKRSYSIYIEENIRYQISKYVSKDYSKILVITDAHVQKHYLQDILDALHGYAVSYVSLHPGEGSKSFEVYQQLLTTALNEKLDRHSLILTLGGGVVGDIGGFVAATYMRGIDYIQMPTTILAHDSSIGGKVGINHEQGKNLIGSFYPPTAVIYDIATLQTLESKDVRSGYAELLKEAYLSSPVWTKELLNLNLRDLNSSAVQAHIAKGIKVKAAIVEADEFETGKRAFLNFGHTLGHAIEHAADFRNYTHGEAVAIGMLFALFVSETVFKTTLGYKQLYKWMEENRFPLNLPHFETERYLTAIQKDKKTTRSVITLVLLQDIGKPVLKDFSAEELRVYLNRFYQRL
ncbi:3-dehydroquinate synthase [Lentibacillus sp. JNUCC-1]|uniref:3-dehydroquinate synthase n=1 Tax=Lentibacillus sp. JNUCC-1 TaxID=2654513 RepID=UPI0012E8F892|nr:3-dehydroquinate synthase [Lentibacillus sp. JNUCC-1]MUV39780.1 3-dehydroquinate synthase [Lentibacillus sp. JNUCC-1]